MVESLNTTFLAETHISCKIVFKRNLFGDISFHLKIPKLAHYKSNFFSMCSSKGFDTCMILWIYHHNQNTAVLTLGNIFSCFPLAVKPLHHPYLWQTEICSLSPWICLSRVSCECNYEWCDFWSCLLWDYLGLLSLRFIYSVDFC